MEDSALDSELYLPLPLKPLVQKSRSELIRLFICVSNLLGKFYRHYLA